jgi:hypothetical protein
MTSETANPTRAGGTVGLGNVSGWAAIDPRADNSPLPAPQAAIVAQVAAIAAYGVEHPEARLRLRCALRDALVELEEARIISAERFLASRRAR